MVSQMDRNEKDEAVMNEAGETQEAPADKLSIEEIFTELDGIIRNLENGEVSLEDSFKYYEAGMKLVKTCGGKIDKVEKQILELNGNNTEDVR